MTSWWNNNIEARINDFKSWTGDSAQPSKIYCRKYIADKQYKTMIDCGCGLATDYFAFKEDNYKIDYTGLDSCKYLVNQNKEHGISMIEAELNAKLPISKNAYECVYCREVLEHLPYYEKTISEFIRIASKEVIIVFFIKPLEEEQWPKELEDKLARLTKERREEKERKEREIKARENALAAQAAAEAAAAGIEFIQPVVEPMEPEPEPEPDIVLNLDEKEINYWAAEDLYHNKYDRKKMEKFILSNPKVKELFWIDINDLPYSVEPIEPPEEPVETEQPTGEKTVLHIILK